MSELGVCILVWNIDAPGGMERQAWRLAKEFARRGLMTLILSTVEVDSYRDIFKKRWRENLSLYFDIYRIPLKRSWASKSFVLSLPAMVFYLFAFLILFTHRSKYKIIYGVQLFSAGPFCSFAGWALRKKVVIKTVSMGLIGDVTSLSRVRFLSLQKYFLFKADAYVILNNIMIDELLKLGVRRNNIVSIPNGVDTNEFSPPSIGERDYLKKTFSVPANRVVIFTGRLDSNKRVGFLLEAWRKVVRNVKDIHLLIAGDGPLKDELIMFSNSFGIAESVTFLGNIENVTDFLRVSDVFVMPSAIEGLSNAILEAMATGLPVIATRINGNIDVVKDEECGILFDLYSISDLADAISKILLDKKLYFRLSSGARKRAIEVYSIEAIAGEYIKLFERMLDIPK